MRNADAVLGIGVNVAVRLEDLPEELRPDPPGGAPIPDRPAATLGKAPKEIELTPLGDRAAAEGWLQTAEGTMAKKADARYVPGKRDGMFKIKRVRTIDTVVVGWRPGKAEGTVGSLIGCR